MKRAFRRVPPRWLLFLAIPALVAGAILLAVLRPERPVPFAVLPQPLHISLSFRDRIGLWIPRSASWAWAWSLEQTLFGKRQPVSFYSEVFAFPNTFDASAAGLALGAPSFTHTNGLAIWLLSAEELKTLRAHCIQAPGTDLLFRPRISTADGIAARLFQGESVVLQMATNEVGMEVECFARVHTDAIDLITSFKLSQLVTNNSNAFTPPHAVGAVSIQTNMDVALRILVPKGKGLFLLDGSQADSRRKRTGTLIDPL